MSDLSLARTAATLAYAIYDYPDASAVAWDYRGVDEGVAWGAVRVDGVLWAVYRGSVDREDWERDFFAVDDPLLHDKLGPVHPGFYRGLEACVGKLLAMAKPGEAIGVTGHSLGAGRGSLATGLLCVAGRPPLTRIVFGEPHAGKAPLAQLTAPCLGPSYRNTAGADADWEDIDQVTIVPPWFDTPGPRTDVVALPPANDPWGPFRFHHMALYAKAVGIDATWALSSSSASASSETPPL